MKLTNYMRDAFVRAAMQDVPFIDYQEQANKLALKHIEQEFAKTFPGVDYKTAKNSGWLEFTYYVETPRYLSNVPGHAPTDLLKKSQKVWAELEKLAELKRKQDEERDRLETKLAGVAKACTTRKALAEALPEFEKYLPADEPAAVRTLPAVANVVSDFVKAGWPKKKAA